MVLMLNHVAFNCCRQYDPARVKVVAVDISQAVVTKLLDRANTGDRCCERHWSISSNGITSQNKYPRNNYTINTI